MHVSSGGGTSPREIEKRYTKALADLRQLASASEPRGAHLEDALRIIGDALGTSLAKILELAPGGELLVVRAGIGWREGVAGSATVPARPSSSAGYALGHERAVIFDDIQRTSRLTDAALLRSHNVTSTMAVRLTRQRTVIGVLSVHEQNDRRFTSREADFLEAAAVLVAGLM